MLLGLLLRHAAVVADQATAPFVQFCNGTLPTRHQCQVLRGTQGRATRVSIHRTGKRWNEPSACVPCGKQNGHIRYLFSMTPEVVQPVMQAVMQAGMPCRLLCSAGCSAVQAAVHCRLICSHADLPSQIAYRHGSRWGANTMSAAYGKVCTAELKGRSAAGLRCSFIAARAICVLIAAVVVGMHRCCRGSYAVITYMDIDALTQ